jgi:hypothetical protein
MTATMKEPLVEPEPLHVTVARRLRGKMGEQQLSQDAICKIVGWNRGYMHRRYVGETALDVNDLAALETVGISTLYLLTGATEYPVAPHPFGAVSGDSSSNPSEAVTGAAMALPDPIEYLRNGPASGVPGPVAELSAGIAAGDDRCARDPLGFNVCQIIVGNTQVQYRG